MQQVLVYADSLTWGIIPDTRRRLPFEQRWPGVLEGKLSGAGLRVRVLEDCLNGRRTVWEDPFKAGRNGLQGLQQRIEIHSPLSLVILMLGTNDLQYCHPYNDGWAAGQGIAALVREIRIAPVEPGMPVPPVLIVCPPRLTTPTGLIAEKFKGAETRCAGMAEAYREVAAALGCHYFDSNTVITSSRVDGVHLDAEQHGTLGTAMAGVVGPILEARV